ncbi:hypothetical protein AB0D29_29020 [Streptomyces sp. NPDC048424]|uniref:hypothetical protein n=1 Tax=Streptomyces sp. NPDC048424 TaxID=3155265 RepID=UPI003440EFDB
MAKIVFTLVWGVVLVMTNRALEDATWAQYLATFLLGGIYALALSKVKILRGGITPEESK